MTNVADIRELVEALGVPTTIKGVATFGIFEAPTEFSFDRYQNTRATLFVEASLAPSRGDEIIVEGTTYRAASVDFDGSGGATILLEQ